MEERIDILSILARWVGTVAHCVAGRLNANTRTVVGSHLLNTGGLNLATAQIVIHPNYIGNTVENDVALVNTQTAIMFNDFIQPIVMGIPVVGSGASATMSGWGMTTVSDFSISI
jgi:secreted trypsin-like serine protease